MLSASGEESKSMLLPWEQPSCRRFSLPDIQLATQNFDDSLIIGRGGFGKVYKGAIGNGIGGITIAAIKRLDSGSNQGAPEFWAEIEMLSKLRHCHLVSLIGYCNDSDEMILVYEYMPLGTLDSHLHKADCPLSWVQRLKICIGAARGLDYLHTGTGTLHGVIHRDVKSSNILLDENWAAKISDFGLSKITPANQPYTYVSTAVKGTFGYLDPEYFSTGRLTRKSDVYAFGVVLLEVLCGRRAVDTSLEEGQWGLAVWAEDYIKEGKVDQLIDTSLKGQILPKCLKEFARIAGRCLHSRSKQRPMMGEIVVRLQLTLSLQESSNEPASINILTRKVQKFFFPSVGLNSGHLQENSSRNREKSSKTPHPRIYTHAELISATMNFKICLSGEGVVRGVYKGWIDERTFAPTEVGVGMAVAVKRTQDCLEALQNGKLDLNLLKEHSHPNLVRFLGYCLEDEDILCVFEFMQNGSLERHLTRKLVAEPLAWDRRLEIAVGAARGLVFLHTRKQVNFNQFKTSHILLDGDFNAKLDPELEMLDLANSSYPFKTDSYYAAPEWYAFQVAKLDGYLETPDHIAGSFSVKSEVYSFGVVLLEILTGQKVYDVTRPGGKQNLVKWAIRLLPHRTNLEMLIDPRLNNRYPPEGAFRLALLILKCLQSMDEKRPSMEQVLKDLEQITAIKMEVK